MCGKNRGFLLALMYFVMKKIELKKVNHTFDINDECPNLSPNIMDDCILYEDGVCVGFFIKKMPSNMLNLASIANKELLSKRVPKSEMRRRTPDGKDEKTGRYKYKKVVTQYSTILGGVPPKPHMMRPYPTSSSVHGVESAKTFVKAMWMLAEESEKIIKEIMPSQYAEQKKIFDNVPAKWRFANLFTSSISNFNIAANFHRDTGNIPNTVNVIITKRENSIGGNLHVPDYNATFNQVNNSMLVYPAWRNVHGVTPIIPIKDGGYRNSLVFYPLKAFLQA